VSAVVDTDGLRGALGLVKTPELGGYRDLREVRPGHLVRVDASGLRTRRYWSLVPGEHPDDLPTTITTVRELLEDIVARQLISDVPQCVLLSGGLDSSVLTALAARALGAQGAGPVRSFAVDFAGQAENFTPDVMYGTPDAPYVHDVAALVASDHTDIVLDTDDLMDPLCRPGVVGAYDQPSNMGDLLISLYLLFRAVRGRSTVALSGESADEVFGGYVWFHHPAMVEADMFPWHAGLAVLYGDLPDPALSLLDPGLVATLDLPGYRDARYRQALSEVEHLPDEDRVEYRMRELFYLNLTRFVQILLDRKDRLSMAHGLEVRVPFCDHRLVEYVYNVPWTMKTFDGHEKSLLRAATADLLPASVRERRKTPYPLVQDPRYQTALRESLRALLDEPDAPVLPLLDIAKARELTAPATADRPMDYMRYGIEVVLSLNEWLRRYPVRLHLD
jgi:asparagine synthase (glutamine-hydrolysing)